MKKQILLALVFMAITVGLRAQTETSEFKPSGTGIGTVFFNYKYDLTEDVTRKSSFNLERAYLGYKYDMSPTLSGTVIFDIGYDANTKSFAAFAKNAYLGWAISPNVKFTVGLIPLRHFDFQEKAWGYRYIMKPHADEYGMGTTADLGFNFEFPVNKMLSFNVYAINGEGFKALQDNFGMHKFGANATLKPVDGLSMRVHYDLAPNKYEVEEIGTERDTATISVFSAFIGYEMKDVFRIGFDYNMMNNATNFRNPAEGYNLSGFSVFGTYIVNPKWEVFARYDYLKSNKVDDATEPWNGKDGSMVLGGVQYKPIKNVSFGLNYRTFLYKDLDQDATPGDEINNPSGIYVNMGIFF